MSENKQFTSNEIIKALECCKGGWCISKNCPLNEFEDDGCEHILAKYTLNLINNLLKENEDLAEQLCHLGIECERLGKENESQKAEIERYRETVGELGVKDGEVVALLNGKETKYIHKEVADVLKRMAVKTAKADAIKEFADNNFGGCEGCVNIGFRYPYASMYPCNNCIRADMKDYYGVKVE